METEPTINFENTLVAFADRTDTELKWDQIFFQTVQNKSLVDIGSGLATLALKLHLPISPIFKFTVYDHFVGGETIEECQPTIDTLARRNVDCLINYGVEAEDSETDYENTLDRNIEALEYAKNNANVKAICLKMTGIGRFGLFEDIQAGKSLSKSEEEEFSRVKVRLDQLCQKASDCNTALYIDAEEYWIQNVLDKLVLEAMIKYNRDKCIVYDTVQLYRHDQLLYLKDLIESAKTKNFKVGIKLVRGAYMEKERERAQKKGYPSPIQVTKDYTDKDYNNAINVCLDNIELVSICVATHNEQSCLYLAKKINDLGIDKKHPNINISQLYGMGDHLTFNIAEEGFNATKYLPFGPVKNIIPYLIRRAEENSSIKGQMGRELSLIKKEIRRRKNTT